MLDVWRSWGWHLGTEACSEPLCPSLQGPPTEEDFSEVMTQVQEVGSPRLLRGRGAVPSVGVMACLRAFSKCVVTLTLLH